jgi:hypothetical protein
MLCTIFCHTFFLSARWEGRLWGIWGVFPKAHCFDESQKCYPKKRIGPKYTWVTKGLIFFYVLGLTKLTMKNNILCKPLVILTLLRILWLNFRDHKWFAHKMLEYLKFVEIATNFACLLVQLAMKDVSIIWVSSNQIFTIKINNTSILKWYTQPKWAYTFTPRLYIIYPHQGNECLLDMIFLHFSNPGGRNKLML